MPPQAELGTSGKAIKYGRSIKERYRQYSGNYGMMLGMALLGAASTIYHRIEAPNEKYPPTGPALYLTSHFSLEDVVPGLWIADPYRPLTKFPAKASYFKVPILGSILRARGALPVNRDGNDADTSNIIIDTLKQGSNVCIAYGATRSRDGRLTKVDKGVARLTKLASAINIPIIPIAEIGTYKTLPPGKWFPRPRKIKVIVGDPINFNQKLKEAKTREEKLEAVAKCILESMNQLFPEERQYQFREGEELVWDREEQEAYRKAYSLTHPSRLKRFGQIFHHSHSPSKAT
ncbi:MAG: 1-acyl-sn-glycerol-3-phosphate acyltransferase [Candidatus Roizmanbacteria bacterium]|nr:MAG: 1-acyl-sn-glycerol-3-phosphate acyltransferase [Candidatus Roizmanbacteria bacterium]